MSIGMRKRPIIVNILNLTKYMTNIIAHWQTVTPQNKYFSYDSVSAILDI